jgi:hypothetical protein
MGKGGKEEWIKGQGKGLRHGCTAGGGPAARLALWWLSVICSWRSACSFLLLQELSKERVIELVSTSSRADEESSIG